MDTKISIQKDGRSNLLRRPSTSNRRGFLWKLIFSYGISDSAFPFWLHCHRPVNFLQHLLNVYRTSFGFIHVLVVQLPNSSEEVYSPKFILEYLPAREYDCFTKYVWENVGFPHVSYGYGMVGGSNLAKGDEQFVFTYSTSEIPHHVSDECLSELAVCSYKARRLHLSVLHMAVLPVHSVYEPNEYASTMETLSMEP